MLKGRALLAALALVAALPGGAAPGAQPAEEDRIVEAVQKSYEAIVDFTADFRQEREIKTLGRQLKSWGKVFYKRPGKMLWRFEEPKGQWALADGKNLYYYQPEQAQILKTPLKSAFRSDIPLSFLLGLGNLKRDFKVSLKSSAQEHHVLNLAPKGQRGATDEIHLGVEKKSLDVLWARIRDAAGNVTTVRFSGLRKGVGLKDSLFQLQVPPGVDVVEIGT